MRARKKIAANVIQFGKRVWKVEVWCQATLTKLFTLIRHFLSMIWSYKCCIGVVTIVLVALVAILPILLPLKGFLSDLTLRAWFWLQRAWCWLQMGGDFPNSEFVRNVFLVVGGIFALIIAWWRSKIANSHQKTANDQLETDARARLDERFQNGAEMLGDNKLFIRVSGITTLAQLSEDHPKEFHVQVVKVLVKFIKHSDRRTTELVTADLVDALRVIGQRNSDEVSEYSSRIKTLIDISHSNFSDVSLRDCVFEQINFWNSTFRSAVIKKSKFVKSNMSHSNFEDVTLYNVDFQNSILRHTNFVNSNLHQVDIDDSYFYKANFTNATLNDFTLTDSSANATTFESATFGNADLTGTSFESASFVDARLTGAILMNTILKGANLSGANLDIVDLSGADLSGADLSDANLSGADFHSANLTNANLSNANLSGARNLTQAQLDSAFHGTGKPPNLDDPFRWDE